MKIPAVPHRWNVSIARAKEIQEKLSGQVSLSSLKTRPRLIAGVDASFTRDEQFCIAGVIVWDLVAHSVREQAYAKRKLTFPYVPGFLSFREAPAILAALRKLKTEPHALMCDGHGLAHPRRFGIACHVGVITGIPSLGCGKSRLIGTYHGPGVKRASRTDLVIKGDKIGSVLRTRDRVKPVFISVGSGMNLKDAETITLKCGAGYRLPEPTRLADQYVSNLRKKL